MARHRELAPLLVLGAVRGSAFAAIETGLASPTLVSSALGYLVCFDPPDRLGPVEIEPVCLDGATNIPYGRIPPDRTLSGTEEGPR